MPQYAVKIGEIQLQSDRPISEADRKAAIKMLNELGYVFVVGTDLKAVLRPG